MVGSDEMSEANRSALWREYSIELTRYADAAGRPRRRA